MKRLILAPHCDDETLGCGGLLAKYADECSVIVVARPDRTREQEFLEAKGVLGYRTHTNLGFTDGRLGVNMSALVGLLDVAIGEQEPSELYLPFPSMHQDHIAVYEAGARAARLSMSDGHHFTPSIYVYDVSAYDLNLYPSALSWNVFEELDELHIDTKVKALSSYQSQAVTGPHPVNSAKDEAGVIGAARQVQWAEQYALIRQVRP